VKPHFFVAGIIGSNFRFEACFASLNSDFQATLQVRLEALNLSVVAAALFVLLQFLFCCANAC
jgi:hypothetical protein